MIKNIQPFVNISQGDISVFRDTKYLMFRVKYRRKTFLVNSHCEIFYSITKMCFHIILHMFFLFFLIRGLQLSSKCYKKRIITYKTICQLTKYYIYWDTSTFPERA